MLEVIQNRLIAFYCKQGANNQPNWNGSDFWFVLTIFILLFVRMDGSLIRLMQLHISDSKCLAIFISSILDYCPMDMRIHIYAILAKKISSLDFSLQLGVNGIAYSNAIASFFSLICGIAKKMDMNLSDWKSNYDYSWMKGIGETKQFYMRDIPLQMVSFGAGFYFHSSHSPET